jgi:hypothetical protein
MCLPIVQKHIKATMSKEENKTNMYTKRKAETMQYVSFRQQPCQP